MIPDQTIGSARTEKNKNQATSRVIQNLMIAVLASSLTLPPSLAWGIESFPQQIAVKADHILPLPPIPHIESMPWINATAPALKIDTLMAPAMTPWRVPQGPQDREQTRLALS